MKKNMFIRGILLLVVVVLLAIVFTGCVPTYSLPPTTGTVYLIVSGSYVYNLYMDYNQKFSSVSSGIYSLYNVSIGNYLFEAIDTWGWTLGYYSVTKSIAAGVNYVYLYTSEDLF